MIVISATNQNGTTIPTMPLPENAAMIICDGEKYIVYETQEEIQVITQIEEQEY